MVDQDFDVCHQLANDYFYFCFKGKKIVYSYCFQKPLLIMFPKHILFYGFILTMTKKLI